MQLSPASLSAGGNVGGALSDLQSLHAQHGVSFYNDIINI